jgi:hypothetical protein
MALTNAERQRRYVERLKARAGTLAKARPQAVAKALSPKPAPKAIVPEPPHYQMRSLESRNIENDQVRPELVETWRR